MSGPLRIWIIKHPCDDLPTIMNVDPDPRSDEWKEQYEGMNGEDYTGWYTLCWQGREKP